MYFGYVFKVSINEFDYIYIFDDVVFVLKSIVFFYGILLYN